VPIESGAVLTLPAEGMQRRSVARLKDMPPPVLLLGTLPSGAGPFTLPFRAPVLADWVFDRLRDGYYAVAFVEPFVFAVLPDRLTAPVLPEAAQKDILARLFAPPPLAKIPSVWGSSADRSWFAFRSDVETVEAGAGAEAAEAGRYLISGPRAEFTVAPGENADFLLFDLTCEGGTAAGKGRVLLDGGSTLEFDLSSGLHVVPLDADPLVLYAGRVEKLHLALDLDPRCAGASVSRFEKAARRWGAPVPQ